MKLPFRRLEGRHALPLILLSPLAALAQSLDSVDWEAYNRGDLGLSPHKSFLSSDALAPVVHIEQSGPECMSSSYVLLSYGTQSERGNQAMMLDENGDVVWSHWERGTIHNLQVQQYRGDNYITFWVGDDEFFGHGHGYFKMFDDTYTLAHTLNAGNKMDGDYHEFSITKDDTAIVTSYVKMPWNLTDRERDDGFIWDCVFQEIDIESDDVIFQWHASEHFTFEDMAVDSWQTWTGHVNDPWDWFHMNSVEKDKFGNYLITARYSNAVSYISGVNGSVLWSLGGKHNNFKDLGQGDGVRFVDPHMARWTPDHSAITLFDNIAVWSLEQEEKVSHGIKVALDLKEWTAAMAAEFIPPKGVFALAEGSMQQLKNGNFFLGFGSYPYYAEFAPNGTLLCGAHFAPPVVAGSVEDEAAKPNSVDHYRVSKFAWTGSPIDPPKARVQDGFLYVSWNGATELGFWKLAAKTKHGRRKQWKTLGKFARTGFETKIPYNEAAYFGLHLTALDVQGVPYQLWYAEEDGDLVEIWDDSVKRPNSGGSFLWWVFVMFGLFLVWVNRRRLLGA